MLRRLVGIVLLLQLGGCAYLASISGNLEQRVDDWVAQQEYGRALDALSYVKPGDPDYKRLQAKRDAIQAKARVYEQTSVQKANRLASDGNWDEALSTLETARAKLPASKVLQEGQTQLLQRQAHRLAELDVTLLIARAEALSHLLPVYNDLARVNPRSWQASRNLTAAQREAAELAAELTRRGKAALDQKNLALARRTLPLALRLTPSAETKQANQRLLLQLGPPAPRQAQGSAKPSHEDETRELLQRYQQAFRNKEWVEAQRLLALLELQPTPPQELAQLRGELNDRVAEAVHRHIEKGVTLYSHGKYEEALAIWRQAEIIDPDNERVKAHIARAERVLEKLRSLQEKQVTE